MKATKNKNRKKSGLSIQELVKRVITKDTIGYPEKALYESFLKTNAHLYGTIKDCELFHPQGNSFGISVVPKCYSDEYHQGLTCNLMDMNTNTRVYMWSVPLKHQLYLHDILIKKWKMESEGMVVQIRIDCTPKIMSVEDGPKKEDPDDLDLNSSEFEKQLLKLVSRYSNFISKPELVQKLNYTLDSVKKS